MLAMSVSLELNVNWLDVQDATSKKKADGTPEPLDTAREGVSPRPSSVAGLIPVSRLIG